MKGIRWARSLRYGHQGLSLLVLLGLLWTPWMADSRAPAMAQGVDETNFAKFFLRKDTTKTDMYESEVVADANGGMHAAFSGDLLGNYKVNYAYCPANCHDPDNWTLTEVGTVGGINSRGSATVAVTPDGRPRMMWFTTDVESTTYWGAFKYAECDANCTDQFNWRVSADFAASNYSQPSSLHYFALDPQGHPRFVAYGDYFVYCNDDNDCTMPGTWASYKYTTFLSGVYGMHEPYLLVGGDRRPRMLSMEATGTKLYYWQCTTDCDSQDDWTYTAIADVGAISEVNTWGLAVDALSRPRAAVYVSSGVYYFWSDADPRIAANWQNYKVLPPGYGYKDGGVDLALDGEGRPHIAHYLDPMADPEIPHPGLGHAYCTANCESPATATWTAEVVETVADLEQTDPIPAFTDGGCTMAFWLYAGLWPSIVIDRDGDPYITYLTQHVQHSLDDPRCTNLVDRQLIRLAAAGGPVIPPTIHIWPTTFDIERVLDRAAAAVAPMASIAEEEFTITNQGTASLEITAIDVVSDSCWLDVTLPQDFPLTVAPGGSMAIPLAIDASCVGAGVYQDRFAISSNDTNSGLVEISVKLTVIAGTQTVRIFLPLAIRH